MMRMLGLALCLVACSSCGESSEDASQKKVDASGTGGGANLDASTDAQHDGSSTDATRPDVVSDVSVDAPLPDCPTFSESASPGNVELTEITEASGVVSSFTRANVLFVHNDSGDSARFFALSSSGQHLAIFGVDSASAIDWEDIAAAKGDLYLGDIGDNAAQRANVVVYRIAEPAIPATPSTVPLAGATPYTFTYPGGARDAETLFVDPVTGDLYIVQKIATGKAGVYRKAAPLASGELELVADVDFGPLANGGDMSPSGDAILVRTYNTAQLYRRGPNMTVAQALLGEPCTVPIHSEPQGESIGFGEAGNVYLTISEGVNQPIYRFVKQ